VILLDTDILIDLLREYPPAVGWLNTVGDEEILIPGLVMMEIIQGCRSKAEQEEVARALSSYSVMWPDSQACDEALIVFSDRHLSHGLGLLDALIGQTAVALNLPLYTFNQRHYDAIPNLKTAQPYQR
jgi:hypothetical protein